jgi:hypothetical protein
MLRLKNKKKTKDEIKLEKLSMLEGFNDFRKQTREHSPKKKKKENQSFHPNIRGKSSKKEYLKCIEGTTTLPRQQIRMCVKKVRVGTGQY